MLLYTKESRVLVYLNSKSYFRFTLISIVYGFKGPWHYLSDFKEVFFSFTHHKLSYYTFKNMNTGEY